MHQAAQQGFTSESAAYSTGRPSYPLAIRQWLESAMDIGPGRNVIDLGAGTGKLTQMLHPAASVIAVEPVAAMRAEFTKQLPDRQVVSGTAEAIPAPSASVDAVVCGQSFHWFANPGAVMEIHRVLKPGGQLGLIWNVRDESVDWVAAITEILTPFEGDAPRFHTGQWRTALNSNLFTEVEEVRIGHTHTGTPQIVILDRFLSVSFIAALPPADKARVAQQLRTLIEDHPALRNRALVHFPYQTRAYRFQRVG